MKELNEYGVYWNVMKGHQIKYISFSDASWSERLQYSICRIP